jgi:hypothetical protein
MAYTGGAYGWLTRAEHGSRMAYGPACTQATHPGWCTCVCSVCAVCVQCVYILHTALPSPCQERAPRPAPLSPYRLCPHSPPSPYPRLGMRSRSRSPTMATVEERARPRVRGARLVSGYPGPAAGEAGRRPEYPVRVRALGKASLGMRSRRRWRGFEEHGWFPPGEWRGSRMARVEDRARRPASRVTQEDAEGEGGGEGVCVCVAVCVERQRERDVRHPTQKGTRSLSPLYHIAT